LPRFRPSWRPRFGSHKVLVWAAYYTDRKTLDTILQRGVNSDGVIIGTLQETAGPHDDVTVRDGWGYDFVAFLDDDLALGTKRYFDAIRRPMTHLLKPRYQRCEKS